ncbi:MAG: hypothetical protein ACKORY_08425 [Actinomycetota bacterium]
MLSWSGREQGIGVDLPSLTVGVPHARELDEFAQAAVSPSTDAVALSAARDRLTEAMGGAAMVDAAAVVANFEMMTRLAECTGAVLHNRASAQAGTAVGADMFLHRD